MLCIKVEATPRAAVDRASTTVNTQNKAPKILPGMKMRADFIAFSITRRTLN
jgi:hypothetical protein